MPHNHSKEKKINPVLPTLNQHSNIISIYQSITSKFCNWCTCLCAHIVQQANINSTDNLTENQTSFNSLQNYMRFSIAQQLNCTPRQRVYRTVLLPIQELSVTSTNERLQGTPNSLQWDFFTWQEQQLNRATDMSASTYPTYIQFVHRQLSSQHKSEESKEQAMLLTSNINIQHSNITL